MADETNTPADEPTTAPAEPVDATEPAHVQPAQPVANDEAPAAADSTGGNPGDDTPETTDSETPAPVGDNREGGVNVYSQLAAFAVETGGQVRYVLAVDMAAAEKIAALVYPGSPKVGTPKDGHGPANGDVVAKQVPVAEYGEGADPKDVAEQKRRGDVNYELSAFQRQRRKVAEL